MNPEYNWYKLEQDELPQLHTIMEIRVKGKTLCIGHLEEGFFALQNKCPHADGRLGQGWCDEEGNVVCPHHRYKFSLRTGKNTSGEGFYADSFPIEEREDGVYVGLPKKKWGVFW